MYYWKAYRDATGKKVRPIFKDYVERMNNVAKSENFHDAGEMWRYNFEDDDGDFVKTVHRLWREIKPLYDLLHRYVRLKLKSVYNDDLQNDNGLIPGHILGKFDDTYLLLPDSRRVMFFVCMYVDFSLQPNRLDGIS